DELQVKEGGKYLLKTQTYKHRYPTCWRCKTELVWRVVDEWYIAMDRPSHEASDSKSTFREMMMGVAEKINWMPSWGLDRELDWLKNMHDWLISKKRYWGLALPVYECKKCGNFDVIGSKEELKKRSAEGFEKFDGNSPHRPWIDLVKIKCSNCGEITSRIPDVGNPWLDAGIVPYSTIPEDWRPADFITESFPGQFKNWFYSLIAMSTALEGKNAFKTVLGFASVRDEHGEEMHKSKGNAIEFNEAADKIGVDVMRWLYLRQNPEYNLNFGYHTADEVRKQFTLRLWNVYSFFVTYANLNNFKPVKGNAPSENILDQWIISRLNESVKNVTSYIEKYNAHKAAEDIENFIINDLSNWYVRRSRERVNPSSVDEKDRYWALQTLWWVLNEYSRLLAPFTPFIAEEIYTNITSSDSVHLSDWPFFDKEAVNQDLNFMMSSVRDLVEAGHAARKIHNIKVRQPLGAVWFTGVKRTEKSDWANFEELIKDELNIKHIGYDSFENLKNKKKLYEFSDGRLIDLTITPELKAEGEARDIVRKIQEERKKIGTSLSEKINVTLPEWPEEFELDIKKKALIENLTKGEFSVTKAK
ncbi:MAG: class I tRNA ligase family protein, partial [Candidatus Levybacteria bacterium]|nr:class I tRNA ligase family protein [Candidatus Levybacteria bacterium]